MSTLGDLKDRIITETTRDDLEDDLSVSLTIVIQRSIDFYAAEPWWFNQQRVTSTCTIANEYIARPTGMRVLNQPFLLIGGVRYDLTRRSMEEIEGLYTTPLSGQPTDYCEFVENVRLWPTPNLAYTIIWLDTGEVAALDYADDASTNYWTNEGQDLIVGRAKKLLYRDFLSATVTDPRVLNATAQEAEAYSRLKAETNRRIAKGRVRPSW